MRQLKTFNLDFIKQRRQELEITLQDAAESMHMKNASTYLKYEKGAYSFKAEQLPLLARTLNCSPEDFFIEKISKTAI